MNTNITAHRALDAIAVTVELSSGNVPALLHEINHALVALLAHGLTATIDLKRIPLAPGEEEHIIQVLGAGEIRAELTAYGRSEITETSFPGAWLVTHFDADGGQIARFIEIARIPEILCAPDADISRGLGQLQLHLKTMRSRD